MPQLEEAKCGPAGGFLETYEAFCALYNKAVSEEAIEFILDLVQETHRTLDLSLCPGRRSLYFSTSVFSCSTHSLTHSLTFTLNSLNSLSQLACPTQISQRSQHFTHTYKTHSLTHIITHTLSLSHSYHHTHTHSLSLSGQPK
jgi:hypothetical protein